MRKNFNLFKVFAKSSQGTLLYGTQSGANFVLIFSGVSFVFLHLDTYIHLTTDHDDDGAITKWQWALLVSFLSNFGQNP